MIVRSFYFLRHGETDWNVEFRMQGKTDTLLNDHGRTQARRAIDVLKKYKIDRIVSSPLVRAYETAQIVNSVLQKPLESDPRFQERDYGEHEGKTLDEVRLWRRENAHLTDQIETETGHPPSPGGERYAQTYSRLKEGFAHWLDAYPAEQILFVAHGGVYRVLLREFLGRSEASPNAQPFQFVKTGDIWELVLLK